MTSDSEPMDKKDHERIYLERFASDCPDLAGARIEAGESPDFICRVGTRSIGVEITRLFHGSDQGRYAPRAVYSFRETIVELARDLYQEAGGPSIHLGVTFDDFRVEKGEPAAAKLAAVLQRLVTARPGSFVVSSDDDPALSPEFLQLRVCRGEGIWSVSECQMAPHLTPALLQKAIDDKEALIANYRSTAGEIWLLLVLDRFPLAGSFSVRPERLATAYRCSFDRVYLLLSGEGAQHRLHTTPAT